MEIVKTQNRKLTDQEEARLKYLESTNIQQYLDKGIGNCWLKEPSVAEDGMNGLGQHAVIRFEPR